MQNLTIKTFSSLAILALVLGGFVEKVGAQNAGFDIDPNIGLETISIPFFPQLSLPGGPHATILSWLAFIGSVFSIGLIVFWIYLLIRASVKALQSEGNEEGMAESFKKVRSIFIGAGLAILFPIVISVVGMFMGLGPLWTWPAGLRDCPNSSESNFYFQEVLRQSTAGAANPSQAANSSCGY